MRDAEKARLHIARAQELLGQHEMAFGKLDLPNLGKIFRKFKRGSGKKDTEPKQSGTTDTTDTTEPEPLSPEPPSPEPPSPEPPSKDERSASGSASV